MNQRNVGTLCPAVLGLALFCASCGGKDDVKASAEPEARPAGSYFLGKEPLYATLTRASGGSWVFTTVTRSDAPIDSGYLVRLNDLTPAFDIRVAECAPQAYPDSHRCSLSHPFREKDAGVLDKLINSGIAVGTAGKVTEISQTYETSFDEATFNQAVDEALVNTGLDLSRRPLIDSLERYDELLARGQADLEQLGRQASAARTNTANVVLRLRPEITGVTDYYTRDIDFTDVVSLTANADATLPDAALQSGAALLPCDARYCAAAADKAVRDLEAKIAAQKDQLSTLITPNTRVYNVRCDAGAVPGYHLAVTCPERVEIIGDQPAEVPLTVTVLSRDFDHVYPGFTLADDRLRVQVAADKVTFTNATNDYLTLTAQTVYYNSRINTTNAPIDLPPGVSIDRALAEFTSQPIDIESSYPQMTPDKAAGATFGFGYAVRYRVASTGQEVTLHDMGRFNVGCVIKEQVGTGSGDCRLDAPPPPPAPADPGLAGPPEPADADLP